MTEVTVSDGGQHLTIQVKETVTEIRAAMVIKRHGYIRLTDRYGNSVDIKEGCIMMFQGGS